MVPMRAAALAATLCLAGAPAAGQDASGPAPPSAADPAATAGPDPCPVLGLVMGMTMSARRTPAVGAVLPVVVAAVWGFAVLFVLGTVLGAFERARALATAALRLMHEANAELVIDADRRARGLAPLNWGNTVAVPAPAKVAEAP